MRILLDTHALLWAITADNKLSRRARELFLDEGNDLHVSVASLWEIVTKVLVGKLNLPGPIEGYLSKHLYENRIEMMPIRAEHAFRLSTLPLIHRDPFDRMIVAQSLHENIPILSNDELLRRYSAELIW
jgi:PIN domain nuclease of toxin-antitoxin system